MDEKLTQLRASWQAKHDEATLIINDDKATGEQQVKAEMLFDDRDAIGKQIDERRRDIERAASLKARSESGKAWSEETVRTVPFSGARKDAEGAFSVKGFEAAGSTTFGRDDSNPYMQAVAEAGAGTFGEKTWELLQSFEYKRDFTMYLRKGQRHIDLCSKTLQSGFDDQGGVFAPAEIINRIIGRLPAPTQLRSKVTTLTTGRDTLIFPRKQYGSDDKYTTAFRPTWTGEIPSSSTLAEVDQSNLLGNVEIPVHTAMLSAPVSKNTIEDSAFPLQAWLESELNQVIDLLYEDMILNGSNNSQPAGIYNNPGASDRPEVVLSGTSSVLTYNGYVDAQTALAPQYDQNACWVMNKKSTFRATMKLVDSNQRPIFARGTMDDGLMVRREMQVLGDPITFSLFAQDVGSSNYPVVYGDLRGYYLAQRVGFSIQVLDQTRAKLNQIELVGRVRFGGQPVEHWRMKLLKSNNS